MSKKTSQEGEFSLKGKKTKPKNLAKQSSTDPVKIEIPNTAKEAQGEVIPDVIKVDLAKPTEVVEEITEVVEAPVDVVEDSVLQEIVEEEIIEEVIQIKAEVKEAQRDAAITGKPLPENIEKLVSFMEDTGGSIEDYVRLNADYTNIDNETLLREFYTKTKPHLDAEDISVLLEDFSYDEELDEERDIRKSKIAFKEEVAKAKDFLEQTKSKYYDEIKLRPGVTQEQKKATDFFNRYSEEQIANNAKHEDFQKVTKDLFNNDFKGFDFNVGEKKFRYGVKNPSQVADAQSDISNFIGTFLNKEGEIADAKSYHKALFAARNADTIAQHFYEQGKADSVKDVMAKSKNITTEPRKTASGEVFFNGIKVKAVGGVDSSKLKIKKIKI